VHGFRRLRQKTPTFAFSGALHVTCRGVTRLKRGGRAKEHNTPTLCADTGAEGWALISEFLEFIASFDSNVKERRAV
jgi:hypothetical protein